MRSSLMKTMLMQMLPILRVFVMMLVLAAVVAYIVFCEALSASKNSQFGITRVSTSAAAAAAAPAMLLLMFVPDE